MSQADPPQTASWSGVFSIAMGVATLVTAEFLPVSLLTPMAESLSISEGMAGQSISATAFTAIFTSLLITTFTRGLDRRLVVLGFSAVLILSSLIVALAPSYGWLLAGRALLGLALGGFWAMAASLAMRLVAPADVPKALSIVFGGVSVSMVIAAPLGSYIGALIGWRGVFLAATGLGIACLIFQALVLPKMPARRSGNVLAVLGLLRHPGVLVPMVAIFTVFAGNFALFTYLRPFLERAAGFGVETLSLVLLGFGIANFIGTSLSAVALRRSLRGTLAFAPLWMAACAALMAGFGHVQPVVALCVALFGFGFGFVPVAWSTWVARSMSHDAEAAGGLQVAVIQLANMAGAAAGGLALDLGGVTTPAVLGGLLLAATSALVVAGMWRTPSMVASQ